ETVDIVRKLIDIFNKENIENVLGYYGASRGIIASKIAGAYLASILNESKKLAEADEKIMFVREMKEKAEQTVINLLEKYESEYKWTDISTTKYKELLGIISERR
ncbi:MAG: hypothetical protein ACRCZH_02970, partial [Cetobacterium sp.]